VEGERLFRQKLYPQAEVVLKDCLQQQGESSQALFCLTVICVLDGRSREAQRWGERTVALEPGSADARYWYGRALLEQGDADAAGQQWQEGLRLSADHAGLLEGMARLAMDTGDDAKAYNLLQRLLQLGVDEGWVHVMMSELARRKGLWATALEHWQTAVAKDGETPRKLVMTGELSILANDTATAINACRRAVELDPTAEALAVLGEAYFAAERHEEALAALRRASALDPDQPRIHFNLANVLEILGQVQEAEVHFRRYLELEPQDAMGHFNYGIHLDKLGRTEEALQQVEDALAINSSMLEALVIQGQLLERLGRYAEVLQVIDTLQARTSEGHDKLEEWRDRIDRLLAEEQQARQAGKIRLLHIVTPDSQAVRLLMQELTRGMDFTVLATRFSVGPTAGQGGDIGWVAPQDMIEPLRSVIQQLARNETSPPVESRGLYHVFKRVQ
jgi:tetratricopeptide (TPR) repeat protein